MLPKKLLLLKNTWELIIYKHTIYAIE